MGIERLTQSLEEILGNFGDRVGPKEDSKVDFIDISKIITDRKAFDQHVFQLTNESSNTIPLATHSITEANGIIANSKLVQYEKLNGSEDVYFAKMEIDKVDPELPNMKDRRIRIALMRGDIGKDNVLNAFHNNDQSVMAVMIVKNLDDNDFVMPHRFVNPAYRKSGLGTTMLKAAETQCLSMAEGPEVNLSVSTAQLDVILWLLKNGFEPSSDEEKGKLEMIFNGDKNLCVGERLNVFPVDVEHQNRVHDNVSKKLYITFEKPLTYQGEQVPEIARQVGGEIALATNQE